MRVRVDEVEVDGSSGEYAFHIDVGGQVRLRRTYQQISWLHAKLLVRYPALLLPPLPDQPAATDVDYAEKKRLQIDRFLARLLARRDIHDDPDVRYFLSASMTPLDVVQGKAGGKPSLEMIPFLNIVIKSDFQNGFRFIQSSDYFHSIDDQEEFSNRKIYVLKLEECFARVMETFFMLFKAEEAAAKSLHQVSYVYKQALLAEKRPVSTEEEVATMCQYSLDPTLDAFYDFASKYKSSAMNQVKEEIWYFGDVFLEYKHFVDCIKRVMNHRTDVLANYMQAAKNKMKKYEKVQRLKMKAPIDELEMKAASEEEAKAEEELKTSQEQFEGAKQSLTKELIRFEKEKAKDFAQALRSYVTVQLTFHREQLILTRQLLDNLRLHK